LILLNLFFQSHFLLGLQPVEPHHQLGCQYTFYLVSLSLLWILDLYIFPGREGLKESYSATPTSSTGIISASELELTVSIVSIKHCLTKMISNKADNRVNSIHSNTMHHSHFLVRTTNLNQRSCVWSEKDKTIPSNLFYHLCYKKIK